MYRSFGHLCDGFFQYGRFNYGGVIMMILGVLLIAAIIYFIWKGTSRDGRNESPLDLLKKRFVNGEISEEEYRAKKETLGK